MLIERLMQVSPCLPAIQLTIKTHPSQLSLLAQVHLTSVWSLCICIHQHRKQRSTLNHTIVLNQAIHQLAYVCSTPLAVVPARATLRQMQHQSLPQRQSSTHGWPLRSHGRQPRAAPQRVRATAGGTVPAAGAAPAFSSSKEKEIKPGVFEGYWQWRDYSIRYQRCGTQGDPVVLVHGFGGNCDHWRKNTPVLGKSHRAFSIDLLGYGYSSKPDPRRAEPNSIYCFETWGAQLADFITEVVQAPAFISCNSVGGLAGLQASIDSPHLVRGVQLLDISLRNLHLKRQSPLQRPFVKALQNFLRNTSAGAAFFSSVATPRTVRNILGQAYGRKEAVTDELVEAILTPGLQPGAVDVFLDFISYSGGPLPEELLARTTVPVSILWGAADPWEDIKQGKALFAGYPCVEEFVELPGIGHCPQDEAPEVVNPLIDAFIRRHPAPQ